MIICCGYFINTWDPTSSFCWEFDCLLISWGVGWMRLGWRCWIDLRIGTLRTSRSVSVIDRPLVSSEVWMVIIKENTHRLISLPNLKVHCLFLREWGAVRGHRLNLRTGCCDHWTDDGRTRFWYTLRSLLLASPLSSKSSPLAHYCSKWVNCHCSRYHAFGTSNWVCIKYKWTWAKQERPGLQQQQVKRL